MQVVVQSEGDLLQELSANKLVNWYKSNDIWAMVLLTQEDTMSSAQGDPTAQAVLERYQDVFLDPKTLPPSRTYDHAISLIPGSIHMNSKPYRYSHRSTKMRLRGKSRRCCGLD